MSHKVSCLLEKKHEYIIPPYIDALLTKYYSEYIRYWSVGVLLSLQTLHSQEGPS